jgi:two-component system chemotaxis response regulator CheB
MSVRNILFKALSDIEGVRVVGRSGTYKNVLRQLSLSKPDIILLEYDLPQADTKKVIDEFKRRRPDIEIVLISEQHRTTSSSSIKALELGAMFFIKKPENIDPVESVAYFKKYILPAINMYKIGRTAKEVGKVSNKLRSSRPEPEPPVNQKRPKSFGNYDIMAIGCSLGGLEALEQFIPGLPADFPIPIVVVQHMPHGFTEMISDSLDEKSNLIVIEARGGEKIRPGYVYFAAGGRHLEIRRNPRGEKYPYITYSHAGPPVNGCRPAVNVLLTSLAQSISGNILTVILSGMGHDGLKGVKLLKSRGGCFCITQSRSSCLVYGMPGEIARAGLSDMAVPIQKMAAIVTSIVKDRKYSNQPI